MKKEGAVQPTVPLEANVRVQRFVVTSELAGQRLDLVLTRLSARTRSQVKVLIDEERVWVAGTLKKAGYSVREGEEIVVLPLPAVPASVVPQDIPLEVLYEDEYLAAINKPAGMVVHPAPGQWQGTLVNALLFHWGWSETADSLRPGIVHRLDKETSGILLIAKDRWTLEQLARAFKERQVHKTYVAVVVGHFSSRVGEIAFPIGRHPVDRKKMSVHARRGREAVSRYHVVTESGGVTLVRLFPATGRTHQLRVHLAAIGHPIVGDKVYGPSTTTLRNCVPMARAFPRQALHAEAIELCHPVSGVSLKIHAPYPSDFVELMKTFPGVTSSDGAEMFLIDAQKKIGYVKM